MNEKQQQITALIWERIEEYAWHRVLLAALDLDIESRRQLEALQRRSFEGRRSVHVEDIRHNGAQDIDIVRREISAYLDLLAKRDG